MRLKVVIVDGHGDRLAALVEADPASPVAELAAAARATLGGARNGPPPPLFAGARPLPPGMPVGEAPLRDGQELGMGRPVRPPEVEPDGLRELRVVGGPGAGRVIRLPPGEYELGAARGCTVRLPAAAPARIGRLRVSCSGEALFQATCSATVDGEPVDPTGTPWPDGGLLAADPVLLELTAPTPPDAALVLSADGAGLDFSRPPRLVPPAEPARLRLPSPPGEPERRGLPLAAVLLIPVVMAGASALIFGNPAFLLFGLLSPLGAIVTQFSSGRRGRRTYREKLAGHAEEVVRLEREITGAVRAEERVRRRAAPDPAAAGLLALGPRRRLWERRYADSDFLTLRVGTAELPSAVEVEDPSRDEHRRRAPRPARHVPVTVPLRAAGVVGIAVNQIAGPVASWLVMQAALLHSPADLRICLLAPGSGESRWGWFRWLPHATSAGEDALLWVGTTAESVGRRIAELAALVAGRHARDERKTHGGAAGPPDVLVVLDGARALRALPGVSGLLRDGPAVGVYALCLDAEERLLPEECQALLAGGPGGLRVQLSGAHGVVGVRPEAPEAGWCTEVARAMSAIRPTADSDEETVLPTAVRLLDLLDAEPPTAERVAAAWTIRGRSTSAVVGVGLDGPFRLDLVADGPHALVAGTTGAGKSELLQTLVASFAMVNRPDELTFVLVDYKGGSAFAECADLPHTVGLVTDLDTHLVERALTSLGAELRRREHMLAAAAAKDIDDYLDRRARDPALPPLPRLVLVIDEFASMVRELPDFVPGLVSIAQRGRSLGIHLILATQRPSGSVTADIRANTNLRIALRTTDTTESRDIIDVPDAGRLSPRLPGRAYARLGHAAVVPFQTARIGGRRPGAAARSAPSAPTVIELRWDRLGDPPVRPAEEPLDDGSIQTDLAALVPAMGAAAARLDVPRMPSPWLPPLPERVALDTEPAGPIGPAFGLVDRPQAQAREPLHFDLATGGHLHVVGSPRSGRSQTLRTLAAALAAAHSCADVHLYGIDCGNGALAALTPLPHTGAVVDRTQPERLGRLLDRLCGELAERQVLLGRSGVADLPELRRSRPPEECPPHVVVMVDRVEVFDRDFAHHDQGSLLDRLARLLRDGAGVGIHLVLAGDRVLGTHRFVSTTEDKIVLRLNDAADYAGFGLVRAVVPDRMPPGRGLRAADGCEVQVAILDGDTSGAGQAEALAQLAEQLDERDRDVPSTRRARRVEVLPDRIGFEEAWQRRPADAGSLWALVGVGGDELAAVGPDLAVVPTFIVGGAPRSGRSTAMAAIAWSLARAGTGLVVVAPRPSLLRRLGDEPGVVTVITDADIALADFRAALRRVTQPTGVVLVDDAEHLVHSEIESDLAALARGSAGEGWALVIAGNSDALSTGLSGFVAHVRRNRCGALLAPQSIVESELVGARVPAGLLGGQPTPGRAHVHLGTGRFCTVQVPAPPEARVPG